MHRLLTIMASEASTGSGISPVQPLVIKLLKTKHNFDLPAWSGH